MLSKEDIETAVKNGMVFNRKPNYPPEPVLTKRIYDLLMFAYRIGYHHGVMAEETDFNEYQLGIVEMMNKYFEFEEK